MFPILILTVILLCLLCILSVMALRARRGKNRHVREQYAFKSTSLLIGLATDMAALIMQPVSLWDIIAGALHLDTSRPLGVEIVSILVLALLFLACCIMVHSTYRRWDGKISRRQHRKDTQELDGGSVVQDFFVVLGSYFKKMPDLEQYQKLPFDYESQTNPITHDLPWHVEFAQIYRLQSNQAQIDLQQDWHAQNSCFISSFAGQNKIAILCQHQKPTDGQVRDFLTYIHKFFHNYLYIIVAVCENSASEPDYFRDFGGKTIEYRFKNNALDHLVDFSEYYRAVDVLYHRPLMGTAGPSLEDVYVDSHCEANGKVLPISPYVLEWLEEPGCRQLALMGEFGMGKTIFSNHLAYQMIHGDFSRVPILIQLRGKSPRNSNRREILSYFAVQYGINPEALDILNANGRLLFILDGFDEMDLVGSSDIRERHFRNLWQLVMPKSKLLITGRPNYFLTQEEMRSALGMSPGSSELPYCDALYLRPFRQEQIRQALRNASPSVRKGIDAILSGQTSPSFLDLISRPSHLFLVSQIWDERHLEQKYRNLTSATIINEFLQGCFERQGAKGVCGGNATPYYSLLPIEREYFMVGLAIRMYKLGAAFVSVDQFPDIVAELIDFFPDKLSSENPAYIHVRGGKTVREFAQTDEDAMRTIINDVRTCGVLVNDYVNNGFMFAHKSFFDLLVAKYFMGKNVSLHDSSMMISRALSKSSSFNARLKNDLVVRKLLAELIVARIPIVPGKENAPARCKKVFDQCRKAIAPFSFPTTPQKLFQKCARRLSTGQPADPRRLQDAHRLLFLYFVALAVMGAFLVKCAQLAADPVLAEAGWAAYRAIDPLAQASPTPFPALLLSVMLLIISAFMMRFIYTWTTARQADLILLTWYYACQDRNISELIVLSMFSSPWKNAFLVYIRDSDLTKTQETLSSDRDRHRHLKRGG